MPLAEIIKFFEEILYQQESGVEKTLFVRV